MKQIYLLITFVTVLISVKTEIETVTTETEFFGKGLSNKHVVVGFFNSEGHSKSEELIDYLFETLNSDSFFKERLFKFVKADYKHFKRIVDHYKVEGHVGLFYYIENQLQEFREMGSIADDFLAGKIDKKDFLKKAHEFLMEKHTRIGKQIDTIEDFNHHLEKHKIIGVYFGSESTKNENEFDKLAQRHIHFHFFKIKNSDLAKTVYQKVAKEKYDGSEILGIIRHRETLDMFDNKEFVGIDMGFKYERLKVFLMYEGKKKMRDESQGAEVFMDVFHKHAKLILYVHNPSTTDSQKEAFEEAVERLPKGVFYASVNSHDRWIGNYLQIFHMSETKMEDNSIYFIHGLKGKFYISKIETEINSQSIEESVRYIVKKNYDYFSKEERQQFEEVYTVYNVEEGL